VGRCMRMIFLSVGNIASHLHDHACSNLRDFTGALQSPVSLLKLPSRILLAKHTVHCMHV